MVQAQHADEEDMLDGAGEGREELMAAIATRQADIEILRKQLAAYSDNDPTELDRKRKEATALKHDADKYTDDIYSMEGWFKGIGQDEESLRRLRMSLYGDEVDVEDGVLKELI